LTVTAQYEINTYTVTFNANGGTVSPTSDVTGDDWTLGSLPTPTRDGYTFKGWFTTASGSTAVTESRVYSSNTTIYAQWTKAVSTLESDRVIPVSEPDKTVTVIAPVTVLSGEFTAGPNPVSKESGIVKFYRQGKRVANCELRIYDATGNIVNTVKIHDKTIGSQARRQVGSWDLCDRNGRMVSEGTYLVKGFVKTSDGKSEKISLILSVR
jgi:uncharacterized repeat protein (TIGR02543 family)